MNSQDIGSLFSWYSCLLILGLASLPLTLLLFKKFWDKGYIFSKTISLILVTFTVFVLSSFKILAYTQTVLIWLVLILIYFNYFLLKKRYFTKAEFAVIVRSNFFKFIIQEFMFFGLMFLWVYVRGFRPDIDNLEKPMDWGFVNSALKSQYLPPKDMWFSGEYINYYYFGHLVYATLTKISGLPSHITYNLSVATVLALTFTSVLSISSSLINFSSSKISNLKIFLFSLTSCILVTFGGNLHHLYKITKIDIQNNNGINLSRSAIMSASQSYWYPDATRFIGHDPDVEDKTIHEFPIYSFVVADLHGHMNNIPHLLLFIATLLSIFTTKSVTILNWPLIILGGFLLSVSYMTNAWDFANLGLFFAVFTFIYNLLNAKTSSQAMKKTLANGFLTIISWYIFTLPFSRNFEPMMEGLKWSDSRSPFWQLSVLYGGFWLICLPFVPLFSYFYYQKRKAIAVPQIFVLSLILTATILVIIPEIFYIKDIYIFSHRRANTMFKLVYASFIMYGLSASYVLFSFAQIRPKVPRLMYKIVFFLIFIIHTFYSYFAIKSNYANLRDYQGLDGLAWYQNRYPDNYLAIKWLNQNLVGQPVVLEAVGDSYTDFNMVSSATGFPTVQGWVVHEWLWRGGYDKPAKRQQDVEAIYQSSDILSLRSLIQQYSIDYVFLGSKEFEKYPGLNEENIASISDLVFQAGNTKIFKIRK